MYKKLAKAIKDAGMEIAHDEINKDYYLYRKGNDQIIISSDSGYESIIIGDISSGGKGYMLLYTRNTPKRNSYPAQDVIAKRLKAVAEGKVLPNGKEGQAAYFDWPEYGSLEKQKKYFAELVKKAARQIGGV